MNQFTRDDIERMREEMLTPAPAITFDEAGIQTRRPRHRISQAELDQAIEAQERLASDE